MNMKGIISAANNYYKLYTVCDLTVFTQSA